MVLVKRALVLVILLRCTAAADVINVGDVCKVNSNRVICTNFQHTTILSRLPDTITELTLNDSSVTHIPVGSLDKLLNTLQKLTIEINLICDCNTMYLTRLAKDFKIKLKIGACKVNDFEIDVASLTGNEFADECATAAPSCYEMLLRDSGLYIAYIVFLVPLIYSYVRLRPLVSHRRDTRLYSDELTYASPEYSRLPSAPDSEKIYEDLDANKTTSRV